jgi:hypothetical protein
MSTQLFKIAFGLMWLFLAAAVQGYPQTNSAPQITVDGSKLSGSWHKPEELIVKSDAIFTGELLSLSPPDFVASGSPSYGAKVKVFQLLKGTVNSEITVILRVTNIGPITEKKPELNHTYIFFAKIIKEDDLIQITKLMDGTDDRTAKVKALIAQAPK